MKPVDVKDKINPVRKRRRVANAFSVVPHKITDFRCPHQSCGFHIRSQCAQGLIKRMGGGQSILSTCFFRHNIAFWDGPLRKNGREIEYCSGR